MLLSGILIWLLPVACEVWRGGGRRLQPTVLSLGCAVLGFVYLPRWLLPPVLVWCAACAAMMWLDVEDGQRRMLLWTGLSTPVGLLVLVLLRSHYHAGVDTGIADWAAAQVLSSPDPMRVLLTLWRAGLAWVPGDTLMPYVTVIGGQTYLAREALTQLVQSFHLTVATAVTRFLPWITALGVALPPLLAGLAGSAAQQHWLGFGSMTPFSRWRIPRVPVVLLAAGAALSPLAETGFGQAFTGLCTALLALALAIIGLGTLLFGMQKRGVSGGWKGLVIGLCLILFPLSLAVTGLLDLIFDFRQLRKEQPL